MEALAPMAEKLAKMSDYLSLLSRVFGGNDKDEATRIVREIAQIEDMLDKDFEYAATRIMEVDFLDVNPDHLLDVAKHLDLISDLIERSAFLFQYMSGFSAPGVMELLTTATAEINQVMVEFVRCLAVIADDRPEVERICQEIADREKVVDGLRESFISLAIQEMGLTEYRIWLKDIFGQLDQIADLSRDLTITLRVLAMKMERQRLLRIKG